MCTHFSNQVHCIPDGFILLNLVYTNKYFEIKNNREDSLFDEFPISSQLFSIRLIKLMLRVQAVHVLGTMVETRGPCLRRRPFHLIVPPLMDYFNRRIEEGILPSQNCNYKLLFEINMWSDQIFNNSNYKQMHWLYLEFILFSRKTKSLKIKKKFLNFFKI